MRENQGGKNSQRGGRIAEIHKTIVHTPTASTYTHSKGKRTEVKEETQVEEGHVVSGHPHSRAYRNPSKSV